MPQPVEIVLDAKDAGAVRAWLAVQRAAEGYAGSLGKVDDATLKNAKAAGEFDRANTAGMQRARKILDELAPSEQKRQQTMKALGTLLQANTISQEQYNAAAKKASEAGAVSAESARETLVSIGTKLAAVVGGYGLVTSAAREWIRANVDLEKSAEAIADRYDQAFRRFQALAGMNFLQGEEAKVRIKTIAVDRAVDPLQAEAGASALASAGFTGEEASGPALNELLKIQNAQQLLGKQANPEDIAASAAQYLSSQNIPLTAEGLKMFGVGFQSLKDTPVTIPDAGYLAKVGGALKKANVAVPEQMAAFGVMRRDLDASEASTGLKNVALNLSTVSTKKDAVAALDQLGLKAKDVDLVGESLMDAVDRIEVALQKVAPERRSSLLKPIVEGENLSAFATLAGKSAEIRQRMGNLNDVAGFEKDLAIGEQGPAAAARRQKALIELETAKRNRNAEKLFAEIRLIDMERNVAPFDQDAFRSMAETYMGMGYEPSQAAAASLEARNWVRPLSRLFGLSETTDSLGIVTQAENRLEDRTVGRPQLPQVMQRQEAERALRPSAPDPAMEKNNALLERSIRVQERQLELMSRPPEGRAETRPEAPRPSFANDDRAGRP